MYSPWKLCKVLIKYLSGSKIFFIVKHFWRSYQWFKPRTKANNFLLELLHWYSSWNVVPVDNSKSHNHISMSGNAHITHHSKIYSDPESFSTADCLMWHYKYMLSDWRSRWKAPYCWKNIQALSKQFGYSTGYDTWDPTNFLDNNRESSKFALYAPFKLKPDDVLHYQLKWGSSHFNLAFYWIRMRNNCPVYHITKTRFALL